MNRHLAIVGGGPFCTYALERLNALLSKGGLLVNLRISIFDRTGHFGAGATHSDAQPSTSYMNRVASQIAFAADESNSDSTQLLPRELRPTFIEWSLEKLRSTSDEKYRFDPQDIPPRYLHGQALAEMFQKYVAMLRRVRNVTVDLYQEEVVDVSPEGDGFIVHIGEPESWVVKVDHILFVTGHSNNYPMPSSLGSTLNLYAQEQPSTRYIPYAYPLEQQVTEKSVPPGSRVAILGLGLTAIDLLLHLTEGRGGTFIPNGDPGGCPVRRYVPSGREPETIIGLSPSGMFPSSRPRNEKALDLTGADHSALQHRSVFLTSSAIATLRERFGNPADLSHGTVRQLDFDFHVFPLVVLEMALVYYGTLFGKGFQSELCQVTEVRYRNFFEREFESRDAAIEHLLEPIESCFEDVAAYIDIVTSGGNPAASLLCRFASLRVVDAFQLVVFGSPDGKGHSPWGHSSNVYDHQFLWKTFFEPLGASVSAGGAEWQSRLIAYMHRDHLAAAQGNLCNPTKAACDGVWRDLRSVLSEVVDFGGLTAESHRKFVEVYFRLYTRMSNGAGLEAMSKVLALVEVGILDVSIGPSPVVVPVPGRAAFRIRGTVTDVQQEVSILIEGRSHPFDPELDMCPLYPSLLRRGIVRRWVNRSANGSEYSPGGLDLSKSFHPVAADGTADPRLTILGAPAEGIVFFQLSAARPQSNSSILNNVARWASEYIERYLLSSNAPLEKGADLTHGACQLVTGFRERIRSLLTSELGAVGRAPRDIVILAIDGIPYELAVIHWKHADTSKMRSVFPTTSSTGWLSSLTGADVARHGIPGVVFRASNSELVKIFEYAGALRCPDTGNIFSDAADLGYEPWSVVGDWEPYDCSWRAELLRHSRQFGGYRFYTASKLQSSEAICGSVRRAIAACTAVESFRQPRLVWCFIDADWYIHRKGYDRELLCFLNNIEKVAIDLTRNGLLTLAHSDHGLIRTKHNPDLELFIRDLQAQYGCTMGGAGRTRWIYLKPGTEDKVLATLNLCLPTTVRVYSADELFQKGSLARARVGDIVLVAESEDFITSSGYQFDHGSLTDLELHVPFSQWMV